MSLAPTVSIIIRTVNRPQYLVEAVRSVELQEYRPIELVIVNSGGPSVKALVGSLGLSIPFKIIESGAGIRRSEAANLGLREATGDYLGFLDDDDILYPFHVSRLMEELRHGANKFVYSDALRAEQIPDTDTAPGYRTTAFSLPFSSDDDPALLLKTNYIPILSAIFSRECLKSGASFDSNLDVLEDWDFWLQLRKRFEFKHLREITSEYRMRSDGSNTVGQNLPLWEAGRRYVQDKHKSVEVGRG